MRYPLWAFFFVLVMPPFAAHALLTGKAELMAPPAEVSVASIAPAPGAAYWTHAVLAR